MVMPLWAQGGVAFFVLCLFVMLFEGKVVNRAAHKRFITLANGRRVSAGNDEFTESFSLEHAGRPITVRREWRTAGGTTSHYRGPRGHLVVIETALLHQNWKMHGVDIAQRGTVSRWGTRPFRSGDAAFDERFTAWQDGVPVREHWLDAPTRKAFNGLFDAFNGDGTVWVQDGTLQYIIDTPKKLDAALLAAIVDKQAALAAALETTAKLRH